MHFCQENLQTKDINIPHSLSWAYPWELSRLVPGLIFLKSHSLQYWRWKVPGSSLLVSNHPHNAKVQCSNRTYIQETNNSKQIRRKSEVRNRIRNNSGLDKREKNWWNGTLVFFQPMYALNEKTYNWIFFLLYFMEWWLITVHELII